MRKGAIQIDYVVAVGIFLLLFAFVAQYAVSYFNNVRETGDILVKIRVRILVGIHCLR